MLLPQRGTHNWLLLSADHVGVLSFYITSSSSLISPLIPLLSTALSINLQPCLCFLFLIYLSVLHCIMVHGPSLMSPYTLKWFRSSLNSCRDPQRSLHLYKLPVLGVLSTSSSVPMKYAHIPQPLPTMPSLFDLTPSLNSTYNYFHPLNVSFLLS